MKKHWTDLKQDSSLSLIFSSLIQQLQYFAPHHWPSCFICFCYFYVDRYIYLKSDFPCEIISSKCFQFDFLRNSCQSISPPDAALTFSSLLIKARNHEWQYCQSYFSEIPERILCPWQYPWIQCYICRGEEISHGREDAECSLCAWYASLQHGT